MGKNYAESSLKRFLKKKIKITLGVVISFLITGMVSFAEENTDKKTEIKKEYIFDEELLKNILREILYENIYIIEDWDTVSSQTISRGEIGINNGTISIKQNDNYNLIGQSISGSLGVNNGTISVEKNENSSTGQRISNSSLGINNGTISINGENYYNTIIRIFGQHISDGFGINNGTISVNGKNYDTDKMAGQVDGQYISSNNLGINSGIISVSGENKTNTLTGQDIISGTGINNGVIISKNQGISVDGSSGTGINNGIIIADTAYNNKGTLYKNGIALKRDDTGKLVLNNVNKYNDNVNILGKDKLTDLNNSYGVKNFSELVNELENDVNNPKKDFAKNIFINNLGVDEQGADDKNNKDNQFIIDTDLVGKFADTHITTAVTENGYTKDEAVVKISKSDKNFTMKNSTIIGYFEKNGTLVDMSNVGGTTLINTVISAVGKDGTEQTAINFENGNNDFKKVTLDNSTVNGKIKFSERGNSTLVLNGNYKGDDHNSYKDGTQYGTYVSDVEFGREADNIEITVSSDGKDKKGLVTLGNVNFGEGDDTLSFDFNEMKKGNFILSGNIDFGDGADDKIIFTSSLVDDNGESLVLINNLLLNRIKNDTLETLQLSDNGNTFYFTIKDDRGRDSAKLNFNGKILGGTGEDIFVVSFEDLEKNRYNFDGGNGTDYIGLTEKYDESKINLFENLSAKNIEGLKLGDFENEVNVDNLLANNNIQFTNLRGGDKDDIFTVSLDNLSNISIDGGADNSADEILGDILKISGTTAVDNSAIGIDFSKVDNVETLKLPDIDGNRLNINNLVTADGNLKFKNYMGGNQKDTFSVSVENFGKLSLIDGGANGTDKGDTLIINKNPNASYTEVTNKGENPNFDFNKIENIEKLEFNGQVRADLDLNNLSDDYLKNLNIQLGDMHSDRITISTYKLEKLKGLNGGNGSDNLEITDQITDRNKDFSFLAKGDGTTGINSIERIYFSENDDIINVGKLHNANDGIEDICGGNGEDTFIVSTETLKNSGIEIYGSENLMGSQETDTLEITDSLILDDKNNSNIFENVFEIEKLVLSEVGNNILVDNLVKYNNLYNHTFFEVIGTNGGEKGNTFIIDGTEAGKKDKALGMKIEGGVSFNDTLKINTNITTENLKNKTGIENLIVNSEKNTLEFNKNNVNSFNNFEFTEGENKLVFEDLEKVSVKFAENKAGNIIRIKDDENIFKHQITNANTIILDNAKKETWTFTEESLITGNTILDLNKNTLEFSEKLSLGTDGKLSFKDIGFVSSGQVTLENGKIKVDLSDNVKITDEVLKNGFVVSGGNEIAFSLDNSAERKFTVESYAFLTEGTAENNYTLKIKSWEYLLQENNLTDEKYQGLNWKYNTAVKNFNEDMGLTGALKYWTGTEIANKVVDYNGEIKNITVSGIDKNSLVSISGNANIEIDQNVLASEFNTTSIAGKIIVNGTDSDGGTIDFTGTTVVEGGIDTTKSNTDITVNIGKNNADMDNGVTLGDIIFSEEQNNILNINNSSAINKIGKIENGKVVIENIGTGNTGFSTILAGANAGQNNSVSITNAVKDLEITTDYKGTLTLSNSADSIVLNSTIGELNTGAGDDTITIKGGESFVSSGTGKDIFNLEFSDNVKVNLNGEADEDILNIGNSVTGKSVDLGDVKVLSGKITDIETYNINKDITFANNLDISNVKNINISEGKNLGLDVDYTITENGKVTGHAIYNKGIEINNNDGKFVVGTANADEDCIISLGKDTASVITNPENVVVSNSINHKVEYDKDNNDITVKVKQDLELGKDEKIKYSHLNKIYQSIVSAKKTGLMEQSSSTTNKSEAEAIKAQLEFYGKIYHSTPYTYSHEISEKSAELITNSLVNNKTMPELKKGYSAEVLQGRKQTAITISTEQTIME